MLNINIKTIPHENHRYETVGDYWDDENGINIRVSDMGNEDYEFCVAVHEMIEQYLCKKRGIKEEDISNFDIEFEKCRREDDESEPGDSPSAPYRKEHFFATSLERLLAAELGIDWKEYDKAVISL